MMDRDSLIQKVRSLPEDSLKEVMDFIEHLEEKRKTGERKKEKKDLLADVIGICEGPSDLAERHDKYVYG
ncbi:MAG: DUF2281 domain-containing protein [Candidatus Freyarchaeum deiterrae]